MHYHAEVRIPNNKDVEAQIEKIMAPYYEETSKEGFWDWYQIGGRWRGAHIPGYNPDEDPELIETCDLCNGTGDRPGWVYYKNKERQFKDDWAKECNGCNGCQGKGKTTSWPTGWPIHPKDIIPVSELPDNLTCATLILPEEVLKDKEYHPEAPDSQKFQPNPKFTKGNVSLALAERNIKDGYLVTVDYHS